MTMNINNNMNSYVTGSRQHFAGSADGFNLHCDKISVIEVFEGRNHNEEGFPSSILFCFSSPLYLIFFRDNKDRKDPYPSRGD